MLLIGIDGGGSHTRAIVVNEQGAVLARVSVGSSNLNSTVAHVVQHHIEQLIHDLVEQVPTLVDETKYVYGGFAGAYQPQNAEQLKHWFSTLLPKAVITVADDSLIALYAGTLGKPGIVQIVGTGSGTYGLSVAGERLRAGGWGYIIDDVGSGYDIGNSAMKEVFRAYDGRGEKTSLTGRLLAHFDEDAVPNLIRHIYNGDAKGTLAPLSLYVSEEAAKGDVVAQQIIQQAAEQVAHSLNAVAQQFGASHVPIVKIGSVWQAHQFQQYVERAVAFEAQWITPYYPAEMGAIFAIASLEQLSLTTEQLQQGYQAWQQERGVK